MWIDSAINQFNPMAQHGQWATLPTKHRALLRCYQQNIE
jgi:hypothetical protein